MKRLVLSTLLTVPSNTSISRSFPKHQQTYQRTCSTRFSILPSTPVFTNLTLFASQRGAIHVSNGLLIFRLDNPARPWQRFKTPLALIEGVFATGIFKYLTMPCERPSQPLPRNQLGIGQKEYAENRRLCIYAGGHGGLSPPFDVHVVRDSKRC